MDYNDRHNGLQGKEEKVRARPPWEQQNPYQGGMYPGGGLATGEFNNVMSFGNENSFFPGQEFMSAYKPVDPQDVTGSIGSTVGFHTLDPSRTSIPQYGLPQDVRMKASLSFLRSNCSIPPPSPYPIESGLQYGDKYPQWVDMSVPMGFPPGGLQKMQRYICGNQPNVIGPKVFNPYQRDEESGYEKLRKRCERETRQYNRTINKYFKNAGGGRRFNGLNCASEMDMYDDMNEDDEETGHQYF